MSGTSADLEVERHDHVMLVRLNRPQRHNAIGGTMLRDLAAAFDEAAADDDIRVVVTTGNGDSFCVGADAADLDKVPGVPARELLAGSVIGGEKGLPTLSPGQQSMDELGNAGRWTLRMWELQKPTIAAVNGPAVGGGFGLALLHDLLVAGASARLGAGFAPLGLAPELGISYLLPRAVGMARAAELLFSGRLVRAEEAARLGLVTEVVDDDALLDHTMALAQRIASMPSLGLQSTKRLLRKAAVNDLPGQLRAEYASHVMLFDHPDTHAALAQLVARLQGRDRSDADAGAAPTGGAGR